MVTSNIPTVDYSKSGKRRWRGGRGQKVDGRERDGKRMEDLGEGWC